VGATSELACELAQETPTPLLLLLLLLLGLGRSVRAALWGRIRAGALLAVRVGGASAVSVSGRLLRAAAAGSGSGVFFGLHLGGQTGVLLLLGLP
jgi:hypothetical protein